MKSFVKRLCGHCLLKINSRKQIFVLGDGRSGTTWVSEVLNFDGKYLEFFEPFHGRRYLNVSNDRLYPIENDLDKLGLRTFKLEDYARMTEDFAGMQKPSGIALSGSLIKDISSYLILPKIQDHRRRNVLLIRNPLSVAMSKEGYGKWQNESDINNLMSHSNELQKLGAKCLEKNMVSTKFLEYVFVWCLIHRIILPAIEKFEFFTIFYEDLLRDPEQSFEELFYYLGHQKKFTKNRSEIMTCVNKRSKTTTRDNRIKVNLVNEQPWNGQKSDHEISQAYDILKTFELYDIYMESVTPKVSPTHLKSITSRWK